MRGSRGARRGGELRQRRHPDRDSAELRFNATLADGSAERPGIPESQLAVHRWLFVAGIYERTLPDGTFRILLDPSGGDLHSGNSAAVRTNPGQVGAFGRDGANGQYHFLGAIDEAWVFAKALAIEEIDLLRGGWIFDDGFERGSTIAWSSQVPAP